MTRFKSNDIFEKTFSIIYCHLGGISCPAQCSVLHPFSFLRYLIILYSFPYLPHVAAWCQMYGIIYSIFINLYASHWNLTKPTLFSSFAMIGEKKHLGFTFYWPTTHTQSQRYNVHQSHCVTPVCFSYRCFFILKKLQLKLCGSF